MRMASRFSPENPELSALWLEMGIQEKQHAGLLQFCLEEELFATELPSDKEIHDLENLFTHLMERAADADLGIKEAFHIALGDLGSECHVRCANDTYARLNVFASQKNRGFPAGPPGAPCSGSSPLRCTRRISRGTATANNQRHLTLKKSDCSVSKKRTGERQERQTDKTRRVSAESQAQNV